MTSTSRRRPTAEIATHSRMSVLEALVIGLIVAAFAVVTVSASYDRGAATDLPTIPVRVSADDTLWDIASRYSAPGVSTQETVALIRELNGLDSALLPAGMVLDVPAGASAEEYSASR